MEKDKVPQDDANILEGKLKVVKYAVDSDGNYTKVKTVGWEPENIVLNQAWDEINEKVELIKQQVLANKLSPIAYHMQKQMLEPEMLSGYTGFATFRVKLHMKPWFYKRLSDAQLAKYAAAFRITIDELINIK